MATFEAQVEGLTSLSISNGGSGTSPSQSELTQFLTDGAKEIINSLPNHLLTLCASEQSFTSGSANTLNTGKVLSVFRSDGDIKQPCRQIDSSYKGRVLDSDDMDYATVTDPVYYIENNAVDVLPGGGSITYSEVQYPAVAYSDSAVAVFPDEAEYLVPLYASLKALQNKMGSKTSDLPSDITLPSIPVVPVINTISYTDATNEDASVDVISVPAQIDVSSNAPSYSKPVAAPDFSQVDTHLDTNEDVELASVKIQEIQAQISKYNSDIQSEQAEFNKENARYQMEFQEATAKNNQDLQVEVEKFRIKADIAKSNKQQDQMLNLTNAAKQIEDVISDNNSKMQKYSSEIQSYQAKVSSEIQNYSSKIQKHSTDYQWLTGQYQQLKADYNQGLQLLTGGGVPQQQARR